MDQKMRAIGLMSGTSMDGIDAAMLETNGREISAFGDTYFRPYTDIERELLRSAVAAASSLTSRSWDDGVIAEAENFVTNAHFEAVESLRQKIPSSDSNIDVIGFHGQTILHRPEIRLTVQLGDGSALSDMTGLDVVYDFRSADVAAGGEGAPLVPVYHRALAKHIGLELPVAFVNIGGVGNVTWIGANEDMLAFDTGPGNALLDDWMALITGASMDRDGVAALAGNVDEEALLTLMCNSYFATRPPKSLDRNAFDISALDHLSVNDGAATLVAFTAETIIAAATHFAQPVNQWIIVGGGTQNPAIMAALVKRSDAPVIAATDFGWMPEFIEAQAFAFMAVRHLKKLPLTYPGSTGVAEPTRGGRLAQSRNAK